ncbi:hypothetical protein CCAX7_28730 [Capsulimonas corticalis]|uniref:Uncharacterized protein n=1 Tax=Capsulimonas corticalis TaxID=2219043 RepID=A0A402CT87_9BACT|nr:hypothetical protein [Capsulimonas corticalis]BDI30822.1 hypothetical protein CCAX7_28730 [Capsulimonas corticalis]
MQDKQSESLEQQAAPSVAETAEMKFERERLARRNALKRFGMTSAMATLALFSVDDLARMVGKALQQRAGDNQIAGRLATEFQSMGAAFATGMPTPSACSTPNACQGLSTCQCCVQSKICDQLKCQGAHTINLRNGMDPTQAQSILDACNSAATAKASTCCTTNHCNC